MHNESKIPEKRTNLSAEELAVFVIDELSDQIKAVLREHKAVARLLKKYITRLVLSSMNQETTIESNDEILHEYREKHTIMLEGLGFDVDELFSIWEANTGHNSEQDEWSNQFDTHASLLFMISNLLVTYLGTKAFQIDDVVAQSLTVLAAHNVIVPLTGFINRVNNNKKSFRLFFEKNILTISRLASIDPNLPIKVHDTYGIVNFSRYPIAQLLSQRETVPAPHLKKILFVSAKSDWNNALNGFRIKGGVGMNFKTAHYLKAIRNGYHVTVAEVGSLQEFEKLIDTLKNDEQVFDHIVFDAHGDEYSISISAEENIKNDPDTNFLLNKMNTILSPKATILLSSCLSAMDDDGIAAHISNITNKKTMGADSIAAINLLIDKESLGLSSSKGVVKTFASTTQANEN